MYVVTHVVDCQNQQVISLVQIACLVHVEQVLGCVCKLHHCEGRVVAQQELLSVLCAARAVARQLGDFVLSICLLTKLQALKRVQVEWLKPCFGCRINTRTGEVKRRCLFAQSNDHPRVNPSFYSKPTRYVYVNMCMTEDTDISNPSQVSSDLAPLPIGRGSASPVPEASNIVPAPAFLGLQQQSIPDPAARAAALSGDAGVSWMTESAGTSDSLLPPALPISLPLSLHAYAPRDPTLYSEMPVPIGGAPAAPATMFQQSLDTAKDRLSKLTKLSLSDALTFHWDQRDQEDFTSISVDVPQSVEGTIDSSMEEDAFPVSANKLAGKKAGSTKDMGSLEWLNLCSGPPKVTLVHLSNFASLN